MLKNGGLRSFGRVEKENSSDFFIVPLKRTFYYIYNRKFFCLLFTCRFIEQQRLFLQ